MRRRAFLRALAGGTVAALLRVQPRQLGEPDGSATATAVAMFKAHMKDILARQYGEPYRLWICEDVLEHLTEIAEAP